jgi:hypothetical protein
MRASVSEKLESSSLQHAHPLRIEAGEGANLGDPLLESGVGRDGAASLHRMPASTR